MKVKNYKDNEPCYLQQVTVVNKENGEISIVLKLRFNRNPIIGDKFASRHGQKGVLSILWPEVDMPFSESGISPDIIINPNAFPSRMTIGMLLETIAAKTGAMTGEIQKMYPFQTYQDDDPIALFGKQLEKLGFNYYGNETLYSGIYGTPMKCQILQGIVYYQRLRHMVSDKSQARATGPVDALT